VVVFPQALHKEARWACCPQWGSPPDVGFALIYRGTLAFGDGVVLRAEKRLGRERKSREVQTLSDAHTRRRGLDNGCLEVTSRTLAASPLQHAVPWADSLGGSTNFGSIHCSHSRFLSCIGNTQQLAGSGRSAGNTASHHPHGVIDSASRGRWRRCCGYIQLLEQCTWLLAWPPPRVG
jgi:hypothetical protein